MEKLNRLFRIREVDASMRDDAFSFRLEVMKKELDAIDSSIRKIDDIGNSIKNWAILTWAGSVSIILTRTELYSYILFTAIPPLIFMFVDAYWRKIQRRFSWRQAQISDFINSKKFDDAFVARKMDFKVLDPLARNAKSKSDFIRFISIRKILTLPTVSLIYLGLCVISVILAFILLRFPPVIIK